MNYIDKPCEAHNDYTKPCQVCNYKEDLTHIDPIFSHPHVTTPYQMKIITNTNVGFWWENKEINYIPYDFFVLKTRLRSYVPIEYDIDFASYQYEEIMIFVVVFRMNDIIPFTQKEAVYYQGLVDDFVKYEHCELIIDFKHQRWQNTILKYIDMDEQYDPIMINNKLLINLHPDRFYQDDSIKGSEVTHYYYDYLNVYLQLQKQIFKKLKHMYKKGVVVIDDDRQDFINEWQLIQYNHRKLYQTTTTYDYDITDKLMALLMD